MTSTTRSVTTLLPFVTVSFLKWRLTIVRVAFGLCHLGESLAWVVAKRGKFRSGFDLLGVARSGCAVVLYALEALISRRTCMQDMQAEAQVDRKLKRDKRCWQAYGWRQRPELIPH